MVKWNATELKHESKTIIVIDLCMFPKGSRKGLTTFLKKNNRIMGAECTARKHRSDLPKEIKDYLHGINKCKKIIIAVKFNQEIGDDGMQKN